MSRDDAWCGREAAKLNNLLRGLLVVEISAGKYFHYASCFNGDTEHINCFASSTLLILTCPTIWDMKVKKKSLELAKSKNGQLLLDVTQKYHAES